ncbi:MAG: hypothetical protein DWQ02_04510, partial [Bacteroidetes bacterium]
MHLKILNHLFGKISISILPLLFGPFLFSQPDHFHFDRLTIEDGLPNPSALNITQDHIGFIWINTFMGVARYDGYQIKTYIPFAVEEESIKNREVQTLFVDSEGIIWLGAVKPDVKLWKYEPKLDEFVPCLYHPERDTQIIHSGICSIQEDHLGRLAVATYGQGIFIIDKSDLSNLSILPYQILDHDPNDSSSLPINDLEPGMTRDPSGNIWIPSIKGISKFNANNHSFTTFQFSSDTSSYANWCLNLKADKEGNIWVPTIFKGLYKFDQSTETFTHFEHDNQASNTIRSNNTFNILFDASEKGWIVLNSAIDIFSPEENRFSPVLFRDDQRRLIDFSHPINTVFRDYSNNIWIGSWQKGIYKYNPDSKPFQVFNPVKPYLGNNSESDITTLTNGEEGTVWIGTAQSGLFKWDRNLNEVQSISNYSQTPQNTPYIHSLFCDNKGNIWVGHKNGLAKYNPNSKQFHHISGIPNNGYPKVFLEDHQNRIWINCFDKTFGYVDKNGTNDFIPLNLDSPEAKLLTSTLCMEVNSEGIWAGTNQQGLIRIDHNTLDINGYIYDYGVHDIHFDREGKCWLSTHSNGLQLFDLESEDITPLKDSLSSHLNYTRTILEDDNGFLWIMTPKGIEVFDPTNEFILHAYSKENWLNPSNNWIGEATGQKSSSGEFLFNFPSGILLFHPDSLKIDSFPPKIAFTGLKIANQEIHPGPESPLQTHIAYTNKMELSYNQNDLRIEFAALHFKDSKQNQYRYAFTNGNKTIWHDLGTRNYIHFNGLRPGNYTLWVKAANCDGVWNEQAISLVIVIHPPWWFSLWAIITYGLIFAGIIYGFYRFQLNRKVSRIEATKLRELNDLRTRLYTNITHEFRTPLTIILGMVEELRLRVTESGKQGLEMITRNGQQLLKLVNRMLDLSKLDSGFLQLSPIQADVIR